jgi:hypothetical protein
VSLLICSDLASLAYEFKIVLRLICERMGLGRSRCIMHTVDKRDEHETEVVKSFLFSED